MSPPSAAPAGERVPLLPCPFCGCADVVVEMNDSGNHWDVRCNICCANTFGSPVEDAIAAWNRRPAAATGAHESGLADRLEALAKKATPGPWNATTWPEGAFMITAGETVDPDSGVVLCQRQDWNHNAEESRANGQLIGDLVNNLPTIIAALRSAPDGWTRFEDRWPPRCEPVLIGRYATEVRPDYWVGCKAHWYEYADKREWSFHGQASSYILDGDGPTHWRPLPPPPAKEPRDEGGNHG